MNYTDKELMQIVGLFKHKDNYYMLLLNDKCSKYYLRLENNSLHNVTLEEYIDINKTFFSPRVIKSSKKIKIEPLIRFKNKLITMGMATSIILSMVGCGKTEAQTIEPKVDTTIETQIENVVTEEVAPKEKEIPEVEKEVQTRSSEVEKTLSELKDIGVSMEDVYPDMNIYKINGIDLKEYVYQGINFGPLSINKYDRQVTPGEFNQFIDKENVTYDDLREVLMNNKNVNFSIKKIIIEGLDNMEAKNFNMDLSTLYYNLARLEVEYVDPGEIGYCIGQYDHINGKVYLDLSIVDHSPEYIKEVIIHEVIGHGSTKAYIEDQRVMCDVMDPYLEITEDGLVTTAGFLGHFGSEGIADAITSIANDKKLESTSAAYTTEVYELTTLCASNGLTIEDYANGGIEALINKMKENGVENPYQLISVFDYTTELMMSNMLVQSDLTDVFIEYYDELEEKDIANLTESSEVYKDYIETAIVDDQNPMIIKLNDDDTVAWIDPEAVTSSIENNIVYSK